MKFKVLIAAVLLAGLFILNGCQCPCNANDPTSTCPLPDKVASAEYNSLAVN